MFKKFSIRKWNHWNNVKMVLKHNAKEKKMDTKKRENELMEEEKRYYADIEIQIISSSFKSLNILKSNTKMIMELSWKMMK
jgi:hypothetical protein